MSQEDHAAGVADDYRDALEGLTMNSRVEISNLTLIARENTESAHAISEVIHEHIRQVAAPRKLPALYLLDSIVKNVGTPYTIFFSRKLYQTFMEAYASVDNNTRRKMDEMLKTWKEPVPGSLDTRPVFAPDIVRPIENALIKARTSALHAQQEQMRSQQQLLAGRARPGGPPPYRETPTPPGGPRVGTAPPPNNANASGYGGPPFPAAGANGRGASEGVPPPHHPQQQQPPQGYPIPMHPQPPPSAPASLPFSPPAAPHGGGGISPDALNSDVTQLIAATRAEMAQHPYDSVLQTRLKALLELQVILQLGNLPQDQLVLVRNQVDELSVKIRGASSAAGGAVPASIPMLQAAHQYPAPSAAPPVAAPVAPPASAPPAPVSLDSLLGKGALAALLSRQSATPQAAPASLPPPPFLPAVAAATPPSAAGMPFALPSIPTPPVSAAIRSPPPHLNATGGAVPAATDALSLIASLRMSGLLPPSTAGTTPASMPALPMLAPTPVSLSQLVPGVISPTTAQQSRGSFPGDVAGGDIVLTSRSLKLPRLYLIATLHEDLGPPCTQCGRRFRTDAQGKAAKTAHMDWHFRVHQRIAEAEKKGQHRSFYVDKQAWIDSREAADSDYTSSASALGSDRDGLRGAGGGGGSGPGSSLGAAGGGGSGAPGGRGGGGSAAGGGTRTRWIPAPDTGTTNSVCPICQEKFEMKWLDEVQEWVWMDAVRVGGDRVFHASCHSEVSGGGGTPEPVLGKRKAEDELISIRGKLKMDPGRIKYDELSY